MHEVTTHEEDTAVTDVEKPVAVGPQRDCLIVIYHKDKTQQGKRVELSQGAVRLGRDPDNDLVLLEEGVSRRHARVQPSGGHWVVMDVGSRNGTLVNEQWLMEILPIRNGDRIRLGSVVLKYLSGADIETAYHEELYQIAIQDGLTGLPNRRRFDDELATEVLRAKRHGRPLSLSIFDVDHFKEVNDTYGHPGGDAALCKIGKLLRARVRSGDLVARIGGEEFAVLMPETSVEGARVLAEQLRQSVANASVRLREAELRVQVSVGCAELRGGDRTGADLYARCDACLYRAKQGGRNRVVSEAPAPA